MEKNLLFLLAIELLLLHSQIRSSATTITNIETDKSALVALKSQLLQLNPSHILFKNWSDSASVCSWAGITCSSQPQRVVSLNISKMGLTGPLVPHLGNLTFLESLNLYANKFQGAIPSEFAQLTHLKKVDLGSNSLMGQIPHWLGSFTRLQVLYLDHNTFEGLIPPSLAHASNLEDLDVSMNSLQGEIPQEIGNLRNLKHLGLRGNQLNGSIPFASFNFPEMESLDLTGNVLSGNLPTEMCAGLPKLEVLYLTNNSLNGRIPPNVSQCSRLRSIYLSFNKLSGFIPREIGKLTMLEELYIGTNDLTGTIPEELGNLTVLKKLGMSGNELTGSLPQVFNVSSLQVLDVTYNKLSGILPADMCSHLRQLEEFYLNHNEVYGPIPTRINECSALRSLVLSFNKLHGTIPPNLGNLTLLETLTFSGNNLTGTLENGKVVAVKVFNLELEGAFKSFEVECEVLRNLRHRNLCKVIDCCSSQDFKALVLEYKPRGSLDKWLYSHNNLLSMNQRIEIMIDVACALEYLHQGYSVPVIHCDLKPSNILLDKNMTACLCDFGIAKLLGEGESIVQTMTLATLSYIAPEYGTGGFVSVKCDVYSYGIVLMEVFTRKPPNDEMFTEDLSLRTFVKESMPNGVLDIIDPNLLSPGDDGSTKKVECLSSILELGLNCSLESPHERMSIKDVVVALRRIKLQLLGD